MPKICAVNTAATPCMIAVPSMLMVAPSGMVNELTRRLTPMRFSRVVMFIGIVALEVAVENAKAITGKNLRTNVKGLRRVKTTRSRR